MSHILFAGSPYAENDALCFLVAVACAIAVSRHYILEHRRMLMPFVVSLIAGVIIGYLVMVQDGFQKFPRLQIGRPVIGAVGAMLGYGLAVLRYKKRINHENNNESRT